MRIRRHSIYSASNIQSSQVKTRFNKENPPYPKYIMLGNNANALYRPARLIRPRVVKKCPSESLTVVQGMDGYPSSAQVSWYTQQLPGGYFSTQ